MVVVVGGDEWRSFHVFQLVFGYNEKLFSSIRSQVQGSAINQVWSVTSNIFMLVFFSYKVIRLKQSKLAKLRFQNFAGITFSLNLNIIGCGNTSVLCASSTAVDVLAWSHSLLKIAREKMEGSGWRTLSQTFDFLVSAARPVFTFFSH